MPDPLTVTVAKLTTVPEDENETESQANQDAISLTNSGDNYSVTITAIAGADGDDGLYTFTKTEGSSLGDVEWIGIAVTTDETLTNIKWNGTALTQTDIDYATALGLTGGKTYVYWVPVENLPSSVTISTVDGSKGAKTITFAKAE